MRAALTIAALVTTAGLMLTACPKKEITGVGGASAGGNGRPDDNPRRDLIHDLEATVLENYEQLTAGNVTAYADGIARDHDVVLIGLDTADLVRGRYDTIRDQVLCDWRPFASASPTVLSKNLRVDTSRKKSVGWISDEMSYRVQHEGREATIPIRFTAVFVRDIDRWVLVVQHMSFAPPTSEIEKRALQQRPRSLPGLGNPGAKAGAERNALRIVQNLLAGKNSTGALDLRGDYRRRKLGGQEHDLILWPSQELEFRGLRAKQAPRLATIFGQDGQIEMSDYRVTIAPDGDSAWVVANLINMVKLKDKMVPILLRATYVLTLREEGWMLVQAHVSAPTSPADVSRQLLGVSAPNPGINTGIGSSNRLQPCRRGRRRP